MRHIINPYTHQTIATLADSTQSDVESAIARAYNLRTSFAKMPAHRKAGILARASALIEAQADDLAHLIISESAKPLKYAKGEVARAVETFLFASDMARNLRGEAFHMDSARGGTGKFAYTLRVPIGVVGAITPFNFPLNLVAHKVAPALAVGCPIIVKPAPTTPLTALRLMDILSEAGLPDGLFQVLVGDADVGHWLTSDPRIAMITFTGSDVVAEKISRVVGLRKAVYELGGNAAVIIDETVNAPALADKIALGAFAYSGQVCISVQRAYIHTSHYEAFKSALIDRAQKLKLGDPALPQTDMSVMISQSANERVSAWLTEAVTEGATILTGGRIENEIFLPTIIENAPTSAKVMHQEAFAPLVCLIPFDDYQDAIRMVNDSPYGLQVGVFTSDIGRMMTAAEQLEVGGVIINDAPTFRVDNMPYGGLKRSGVGREGVRYSADEMTITKLVVIS
ncbi:MAG: aldehyde dehydrogenase family protein [Anaerolineae bacterium]|nr:aldehyde dehydrogenase family protein [Anaerolineae bacterium]